MLLEGRQPRTSEVSDDQGSERRAATRFSAPHLSDEPRQLAPSGRIEAAQGSSLPLSDARNVAGQIQTAEPPENSGRFRKSRAQTWFGRSARRR